MTNIAVSYFILVGVQITLISSQETTTSSFTSSEDFTPSVSIDGSFISITNVTNSTESTTVNGTGQYSTSRKFPDVTPAPPVFPPTPSPIKTTTKTTSLTTPQPASGGSDSVGIIVLVVIIVIALLATFTCFLARNRGRRYSVDLTSRQDEAQIPLSTVEAPAETVTPNGLQFEGIEEESHEPEVKVEDQVEQEAEPEKATDDASADRVAPPADTSEDRSQPDVPEQSPAAPVELSGGEKTDDEGAASNKTSVESLKESNEANENNSNNTVLPQSGARDIEAFVDMHLKGGSTVYSEGLRADFRALATHDDAEYEKHKEQPSKSQPEAGSSAIKRKALK